MSEPDPLHLVLREPLLGAVIKLGRARAFVRRHLLRAFKRAAIGEVSGDAGRAEGVIADRRVDAGRAGAPACRRIMRHASDWFIGCSDSTVALCPRDVRNSQPFRSSAMPAAAI